MDSPQTHSESRRRVLLVDGERQRAADLAQILGNRGHSVSTANDAREALRQPLPEVAVIAAGLPDGCGIELLAELRERGGDLGAVLFAEDPSFADCRRAWKLGAVDLLSTPVDGDELSAAVERIPVQNANVADAGPELRWRATRAAQDAGVLRALLAAALETGLSPACRARLAGAAAEAIENARQHAYPSGAGCVEVSLRAGAGRHHVVIADQGCGFDVLTGELNSIAPAMPGRGATPGGLARLRALADDTRISSTPGAGTRVEFRIDPHQAALDGGRRADLSDQDFLTPDLARRLLSEAAAPATCGVPDLPPALAVALGRLLAASDSSHLAQRALWS